VRRLASVGIDLARHGLDDRGAVHVRELDAVVLFIAGGDVLERFFDRPADVDRPVGLLAGPAPGH